MDIENEIQQLKQRIKKLEELLQISESPIKTTAEPTKRDTSRYMYNGKIYPKNRLVFAVIDDYAKHNTPTLTQLQNTFDKSLQGSLNVVEDYEIAKNITDYAKRYFSKPEDLFVLKDNKTAVVCTQWGIFNIPRFIKVAQSLGYDIQKI